MTWNDLECLFHIKIRFRPARLSRAYLCVSWAFSLLLLLLSYSNLQVYMFVRCVMLCEPLRMDARSSESWSAVLGRFRQLLLASYSRCIDQYEEHIRAIRERRTEPLWSFCEYFILQVLSDSVTYWLICSVLVFINSAWLLLSHFNCQLDQFSKQ